MGNSQSVPEKKDAHRLSKAKVLQPVPGPPSPPAVAPGQTGDPELSVVAERTTLDLLQQSPSQIRLQNASFVTAIEHHPSGEPNEEAAESKPVSSRESSTGLLSKSPPDESPPNLPFDPKQIDLKTAVAILEELRKTASPEDLVALHRALLPRTGEPSTAGESGAASVIRPRSLATPGVATRKVSRSAQIEGRPNRPWKPDMLGASPLSRLEELGETITSRGIDIPARAVTPSSMDYSHTGTYRIGSLVVTNGAPVSPGPSLTEPKTLRASLESKREEDYFTADEAEKIKAAKAVKRKLSTKGRRREIVEPSKPKISPPAHRRKGSGSGSSFKPELSDSKISATITTLPTSLSTSPRRFSGMPNRQSLPAVSVDELLRDPPHVTGSRPPGVRRAKSNSSQAPCLVSEDEDGAITGPATSSDKTPGLIFGPMELDEREQNAPMRQGSQPVQSPDLDQIVSPVVTSHADLSDALLKSVPTPRVPLSMSDSGYSSSSTHGFESASELNSQRSSVSSPGVIKLAAKVLDNMDDRAGLVESPLDIRPSQPADMEFATGLGLSPIHSAESTVKGSPDPSLVDVTKRDRRSKTWRSSFIRLPLSRLRTLEVAESSGPEPGNPAKPEKLEKTPKAEKPKKPPKPEKAEKPAKAPKAEKFKTERPVGPEKAKPERVEKPGQAEKANDVKASNKKLQKRRPGSMVKVMSFDSSLQDAIPRIPPDTQQRLEERAEESVGATGVTGIQFIENEQAKTTLAVDAANIDQAISPLASARYYNPEHPQSMLPAAAPGVPSGPSSERAPQRPATVQRRLSLTRLGQSLKAKATGKELPREQQTQLAYHSDEGAEEQCHPHESASIGSVSQSLGLSAYELGAMAQRPPSGSNPGPGPGQQRMTFLPWNGPPGVPYVRASRVERPSLFHGRHRPKSFHGHGRGTMEALGEVDEAAAADAEYQSEHERRVELPASSGDADAMAVAVIVSATPSSPVELEAPTKTREETVTMVQTTASGTASGTAPATTTGAAPTVVPKASVPELPATPVDPTFTIAGPRPEAPAPEARPADPLPHPSKIRRPQIHGAASYPPSAPRRSVSTTAVPAAPSAPADWAAARELWSYRRAHAAAAAAPDGAPTVLPAKKDKREEKKMSKLRPSRSASLRARLGLRASRSQPELRVAAVNWVIDEAYDEDDGGGANAGEQAAAASAPTELYPRSLEAPIAAVPPLPVGAWARSWAAAAPTAPAAAAAAAPAGGESVAVAAA